MRLRFAEKKEFCVTKGAGGSVIIGVVLVIGLLLAFLVYWQMGKGE